MDIHIIISCGVLQVEYNALTTKWMIGNLAIQIVLTITGSSLKDFAFCLLYRAGAGKKVFCAYILWAILLLNNFFLLASITFLS